MFSSSCGIFCICFVCVYNVSTNSNMALSWNIASQALVSMDHHGPGVAWQSAVCFACGFCGILEYYPSKMALNRDSWHDSWLMNYWHWIYDMTWYRLEMLDIHPEKASDQFSVHTFCLSTGEDSRDAISTCRRNKSWLFPTVLAAKWGFSRHQSHRNCLASNLRWWRCLSAYRS